MAVAYASSAGASLPTLGSTSLVLNKPSGTVDGDLLLVFIVISTNTTITPPSGWNTTVNAAGVKGYWKIASSEPSSYTFTRGSAVNTIVGTIARITGIDTVNPIDTAAAQSGGSGTAIDIPSVTVTNGTFLFQIAASLTTSTFTPPGTATEDYDSQYSSQNFAAAGGHETVGTGATGTRSWTASTSGTRSGIMWAIKPAPQSGASESVTAGLSGAGATGRLSGASQTETVGLSAAGGTSLGGSRPSTVALSAAGSTGIYGDADQIVTTTFDPHESTINESEGTETVDLEGEGSAGALSGASQVVTTGLTASVDYGTTGSPTLDAAVGLTAGAVVGRLGAAELDLAASIASAGSANYTGDSELELSVAQGSAGLAVRRFLTPTQNQSMPDYFWGRYSIPVGISLVKVSGHYTRLTTPTHDELEEAGTEGTDWFRGGYEYIVSEEVWDALVADGFAQA